MDREKRWKRITALFLASVAVFGFAEYSDNEGQGRKKFRGKSKIHKCRQMFYRQTGTVR